MRCATWMLAAALACAFVATAAGCVTKTERGLIMDLGTMPPTSPVPGEDPLDNASRVRPEEFWD